MQNKNQLRKQSKDVGKDLGKMYKNNNPLLMRFVALVYILFPIWGLFSDKKSDQSLYIVVLIIFSCSYIIMIFYAHVLKRNTTFILLVIHYIGICYFVYAGLPFNCLFLFYSSFALPFIFRVKIKSKEFYAFISTMLICAIIIIILYPDSFVEIVIFYFVILAIMLNNYRMLKEHQFKKDLEEKNQRINVLIADQERNRIGQDLHDSLGHVFASLTMKSELATKLIDKDPEAAKNEMIAVNELSRDALNKVRVIIDDLKVQSFEEEVTSVERVLHDANLNFEFHNKSAAQSLNPAKQSILSMILKEAINNVIKHAQATKVTGELTESQETLTMIICDNGVGIDTNKVPQLKSISNRVKLLNGSLTVKSDNGTKIEIEIPRGEVQ